MSQVPVVSHLRVFQAKTTPMTWNGTLADAAGTETHFLHLSAFPCEKCSDPVIAGWLGTRCDDISRETNIRNVGATCIACGFRPGIVAEPSVDHRFRPVEWMWAIREHWQKAESSDHEAKSIQDTDAKP